MERKQIRAAISEMFPFCTPEMGDKVENMLYRGARTPEDYADPSTLFDRVVWYVKTKDYASRVRQYGVAYSCGFFHDDTAYVDHVRSRYICPWDAALASERAAFLLGYTEAYHGSHADGCQMWFAWVKAAFKSSFF